jgi:N-acyl-D-aspartate/D-glutamate deacylase
MAEPRYDLVIENGLFFDGTGRTPPVVRHVAVRGGNVAEISAAPIAAARAARVVDARGCWVMPGFIDLHTHYDAEVEVAPSLSESVRHGVTTVLLGSCSLSLAVGTAEDLADMYCRVEAIPYHLVRPLLEERKTWNTLPDYFEHLETLPLGPNVASFVGHSAIRAHVMGIERSLSRKERPTRAELARMEHLVTEGLDAGYLGLSIQTLPWDKMGGSRVFRSRPLPSTFATWSEYRRLLRPVRARGRIFQGVPNVTTKINVFLFLLESMGFFRKKLKTTVISLMDLRCDRKIAWLVGGLVRLFNRFLRTDFRMQALPEVFDLWADGIDLVVFEEFGAGTAALHVEDPAERARLLSDPAYRARFRREWTSRFLPKVFHRDFNASKVLACPKASYVGRSFAEIARDEGRDPVDVFLDAVVRWGTALRWYTVMANDRREVLEWIVSRQDVLIGFSDAGAHLRQMAHYNFPLRMLKLAYDAEKRGAPFMPLERAVWRLTGEIAEWLGLERGVLAPGHHADLVVIDPKGLDDDAVHEPHEAELEGSGGFVRLVRRNERAVRLCAIRGEVAVEEGVPVPALGREKKFGAVLRAR